MRYDILLKTLRVLMYVKRFFWWMGARISFVLDRTWGKLWRVIGFFIYKISYGCKRLGFKVAEGKQIKRGSLQIAVFLVIFILVLPQTKAFAVPTGATVGVQTVAYNLMPPDEEYSLEQVTALPASGYAEEREPAWRQGAVAPQGGVIDQDVAWLEQDIAGSAAGGLAVTKPMLMPGAIVSGTRTQPIEYMVVQGDSLSSIAYRYNVSVATLLWENKLSVWSILRPGDRLIILPVSGLTHKVKKGDNLKKIAVLYKAKVEDIVKINKLKEDGTDLKIGEQIMVPGGVQPQVAVARVAPAPTLSRLAAPPASRQAPGARGFVWPAAARSITQYYNWRHHALDISGVGFGSAIYASRAGTVEISQCGWNSGYGCYIVINHGNGAKTLYGHNSRLLVSVGDYVEAGQSISLMGNTGKVRGITGIHLHFEIIINGVRVNPLGYVR